MKSAPKDGSLIVIKAVSGGDRNDVLFEGLSNWRSEDKPALHDPLTGECFSKERTITGWMRHDAPYRIPGIPVGWKEYKEGRYDPPSTYPAHF